MPKIMQNDIEFLETAFAVYRAFKARRIKTEF
jgi:hypothetical protein